MRAFFSVQTASKGDCAQFDNSPRICITVTAQIQSFKHGSARATLRHARVPVGVCLRECALQVDSAFKAFGELWSLLTDRGIPSDAHKTQEPGRLYVVSDSVISVGLRRLRSNCVVRCWNYSEEVGADEQHPLLCERCSPVIRGMGFELPASETEANEEAAVTTS